jgi:glycine oxidase
MAEHFLIIGGGAVGLASAQALLRSGYRVTVLERGSIGQEASWAGGGIMSPLCSWDYSDAVTRLTQRSMGMFAEATQLLHASTGINPEYQRSGMLILPPYQDERATQWCAAHQVALQHVALNDYLHGLQGDGLLMPDIGQVRNPRLLSALRRSVELLGGVILEGHEALSFEVAGEKITGLQTSQGRLSADGYIVAAGAWSKTLLGEHALKLSVRPIRGQILLFKFDAPPFTQILLQESLYLIPRADGHVLVGSTLEDVGFDKSTTAEARDSLLQRVYVLFPDWRNRPVLRHWAGLRPGSTDNIPTIGRHPQLANLYANCGHFRYGVTMSLACAELLVGEIEGRAQPLSVVEYRWRE